LSEEIRIRTRRAGIEDAPAIKGLWRHMMDYHVELDPRFAMDGRANEHFELYLTDTLNNFDHAVFVATRENQIVGYTIVAEMENPAVFKLKRYGFICEICTGPEHKGKGVGRVLFDRAVRWCKRRGLEVVQLNASPLNEAGKTFYQQLGFKPFLDILWLDLKE
jgi:GNAT superfamily N-acetyltransferase